MSVEVQSGHPPTPSTILDRTPLADLGTRQADQGPVFGHAVGDVALAETAGRLRSWCERHGLAGRLGGDEFVAVIRDLAAVDLNALTAALHQPLSHEGVRLPLAASVGGVCAVADLLMPCLPDALAAADAAMYAAKGRDRRRVRCVTCGPSPPTAPPAMTTVRPPAPPYVRR
ncbi:diguanylate cyclase domain-containing protein [Streptomyces sp. NPDC088358]|uniref:diguanylate cyclase domain-containing protein n=1 Tax=Streptomyces sp. NPDC088358 TaxID=3365857 RepID=UPI0037F6F8A8